MQIKFQLSDVWEPSEIQAVSGNTENSLWHNTTALSTEVAPSQLCSVLTYYFPRRASTAPWAELPGEKNTAARTRTYFVL